MIGSPSTAYAASPPHAGGGGGGGGVRDGGGSGGLGSRRGGKMGCRKCSRNSRERWLKGRYKAHKRGGWRSRWEGAKGGTERRTADVQSTPVILFLGLT